MPLDQQWGDGWERVPYEQHAGAPYDDGPDQILTVAFDGPLYPPHAGYDGKMRSVIEINQGDAPWLRTQDFIGNAPKEAANAYAPYFIADCNGRFGRVPRSTFDAHRPLPHTFA